MSSTGLSKVKPSTTHKVVAYTATVEVQIELHVMVPIDASDEWCEELCDQVAEQMNDEVCLGDYVYLFDENGDDLDHAVSSVDVVVEDVAWAVVKP